MKAIVCTRYGPPEVLQLREVDKPAPKPGEVLVRVHATTVTAGDSEIRRFQMPLRLWLVARLGLGILRPRKGILGQEMAGEVESVGTGVTLFRKGDRVFARTGFAFGAYAEYVALPANGVIAGMPSNMSYEEAACVPMGGLEALHYLKRGDVSAGEQVLIIGAGGSIGTFAVQIARSLGAEVTGVDSWGKMEMIRSIGADHVIDYREEDFTKSGKTYDVIFDIVGKSSFSSLVGSLKEDGMLLLVNPGLSQIVRGWWTSRTGDRKVIHGAVIKSNESLISLRELIQSGKVRSVIDRRYPLEQMVEAHRYVDEGHKKGNVVIVVNDI